jgi:NADPH:quinone reductase-like Zn-dependent oxidoreductase
MVERCKELGAKAIILTAACSQIGRMIINVCKNEGIKVICHVRREEQVKILKDAGQKFVINSSSPNYRKEMGGLCMKLRPSVCLECVAGETVGEMLDYMGFDSTVIIYGMLSEKKACNISPVAFIGKKQKIEAFLLNHILMPMSLFEFLNLVMKVEKMYGVELKTDINARFGLHDLKGAIAYYKKN